MQDAKMHVDIICLHVNMIYFACRGSFTRNIQVLAVSGWIKQRISLGLQFRMTPIKICRKYWLEKKSSTKGNRTISRYGIDIAIDITYNTKLSFAVHSVMNVARIDASTAEKVYI